MDAYHKPLRTAAVLGAGTMGAQIAAHLANAGMQVHLLDLPATEGARNAIVDRNLKAATKARPTPFFTKEAIQRITTGNFEDDFSRIADADWVIEAVVERLHIKRKLIERIEKHARADAIVSTNTSGIPVHRIMEGRSAALRRRALGTHFFNPPRYLELLELVPTQDTDPAVVAAIAAFARVHLGKGIVIAKDVPYFIGNRIGIFAMMDAMEYYTRGQHSIEEVDTLTGPLTGRPKSATFRTIDLVGLDVMQDIGRVLYVSLPHDESRERFKMPEVISTLVAKGALGAKTRAGFYTKRGGKILSLNQATGEYQPRGALKLGKLKRLQQIRNLPDRLRALYADEGPAGAFFRATTLSTLGYAARRLEEVAESPVDIDNAMRWGFGWQLGPFQLWDTLGFDQVRQDMDKAAVPLPSWVEDMAQKGTFYKDGSVFVPSARTRQTVHVPPDEVGLAAVHSDDAKLLWSNEEALLWDFGDGVALFEFRSKANTLGSKVIVGLMEAIDLVENNRNLRGMVIGNEGKNFSVGANLKEMQSAVMLRRFSTIDAYIDNFQQAMQRVHYAVKPVVAAVHQRALGGGCELVMSCATAVAAAETYIGLVEVGVGLIPAGTGCMRIAVQASRHASHDSEIMAALSPRFVEVAKGTVATGAAHAKELGYLPRHASVVMRRQRRLHAAKCTVVSLSEQGYMPPSPVSIRVLGQPGFAALKIGVHQLYRGGFATKYDCHLAEQVAYVMTGGDLSGAQNVTEQYLLDLERTVFVGLLKRPKTLRRIVGMLTTGKPVRN